MKSGQRTQLEKWNAKYSKDMQDTESMLRSELDRKQMLLDTLIQTHEKSLANKGEIEEAAAVLTYSGMEIFASSFGNSVTRIFQEEAIPLMRQVFREEIQSVLRGVMSGYRTKLEGDVKLLMNLISPEDLVASASEVTAPEKAPESVRKAPDTSTTLRTEKASKRTKSGQDRKRRLNNSMSGKDIAQRVASMLMQAEGPMKLSDIKERMPDITFVDSTITNVRRYVPEIVKAGFGMYTYSKT
jgi:hypothetical protein